MPLPKLWAEETWARFNEKFAILIDEQSPPSPPVVSKQESVTREEINSAKKIGQWWKRLRNSGKSIPINPNGQHTQAFRTYLNGKIVKKKLSFDTDKTLLAAIKMGNWHAPCFQDPNIHLSLLNLFASGKIGWQQKGTLSSVLEGQNSFGAYQAYPIVTAEGNLTEEATRILLPFLHKGFSNDPNNKLTDEQMQQFLALVNILPESEKYFFVFSQQKTNGVDSSPSPHNLIREVGNYLNIPGSRMLKINSDPKHQIPSKMFPLVHFSYEGLLKLSFGAENALGLAGYGIEDWFAMIPILGKPSLNNVDFFGHHSARPGISTDSISLGLLAHSPDVHGSSSVLSDVETHDLYHRVGASSHGKHVHQAIERIIDIARKTFGFRWSKDIWLLRDFDLLKSFERLPSSIHQSEDITKRLVTALLSPYIPNQLENCTPEIKKSYAGSFRMFTPYQQGNAHSFFPHQILLAFLIDLVRHPESWQTFHIVANEDYFDLPYKSLLQMTKYLHEQGLFNDNMKGNILKLEAFAKNQTPLINKKESFYTSDIFSRRKMLKFQPWDGQIETLKSEATALCQKIEAELSSYHPDRNNRTVFLGFTQSRQVKQAPEENVDTLDHRNTKRAKF